MAKKKQTKKHHFKYAEPVGGVTTLDQAVPMVTTTAEGSVRAALPGRNLDHVQRDLRRLGWFALSLIAFELILWALFDHTGLGTSVYNLVHV